MPDLTAKRTLVKSPPELWSELSELERLAHHLEAFGEIKITKLEPEHTVAWEGESASGTVSIEPSGWGTKVTLTAQVPQAAAAVEPEPAPEPAPESEAEADPVTPAHVPRRRLFARLFGRSTVGESEMAEPAAQVEPPAPEPEPEPADVPEPTPVDETATGLAPDEAQAALDGTLDALGSAHHRPFSRG
jgi:hypothetical protein